MSHADIAEAAIGMPQAAQDCGKPVIFGNVLVFLLSLTLHTAALAALWFLAVPASGAGQGGGTDGYITVSLLGGLPGDSGGAGSGTVPANAADAAASSATESEPSDAKAHEPPSVTIVQETVPVPVPGADHVTQHAEADPAKPALPFLTQCSLGPPHSKFRPDADFDVLLRKPAGQALYRELAECTFPRSVWHEKTKQLLRLLPSRMQGRYVGTDPAEFIGKVLTHGAVLKQRELAAALHHDAWRVPHINDWSYSEPAHYGGTASISAGDLKAVAQLSLHFELPKNAEVFRYSTACRLVRHPGQASALSVAEGPSR